MTETQFTPANARIMAARAAVARRIAAEKREAMLQEELAKPIAPALLPDDVFRLQSLARVRKQMDNVFGMMDDEQDPQKIDRLASALARLNEAERQLSNRSLPPSQKPVSPGKRRDLEPSGEPMPAQPSPAPKALRHNDPNEPNG